MDNPVDIYYTYVSTPEAANDLWAQQVSLHGTQGWRLSLIERDRAGAVILTKRLCHVPQACLLTSYSP